MPKIASLSLFIIITFLGMSSSHCSSQDKNKMIPFGPEVKADLVIYFNAEVTDEQIDEFWRETLSKPHPEGRGYDHRDGVGDISRVFPPVQGHEGIAVNFFANATQAQREEVKADVMSSPLVYRVLENVAPKDVKNLDK